jgi:hypothetical protein
VTRPTAGAHHEPGHNPDDKLLNMAEVAAIVRAPVAAHRYWRHVVTDAQHQGRPRGPLLAIRNVEVAQPAELTDRSLPAPSVLRIRVPVLGAARGPHAA